MPQLLPKVWTFAVLSAEPKADSSWGMCGKVFYHREQGKDRHGGRTFLRVRTL